MTWHFSTRRMLWIGFAVLLIGSSLALASADTAHSGVNADGLPDIVFSTYTEPVDVEESCVGDGAGGFTCTGFNTIDTSQGLAMADFDRDGDVDALVANDQGGRQRLCLNDGTGAAYTCSEISAAPTAAFGVSAGDVDNDGDFDAVFVGGGPDEVCLNTGSGAFTCSDFGDDGLTGFDVALGDVNKDGNLDAVFHNEERTGMIFRPGPQQVCFGDGAGGFSCSDIGTESGVTLGRVELGDVNADGNLDAVFSNTTRQRVCMGDGMGGFSCHDVDTVDRRPRGIALGDINNDSNLDVVFASASLTGSPTPNRICLGDGTGLFTCSDFTVGSLRFFDADLGDLNLDGNLDLALADTAGPNPVCFGNGTGDFPTCTTIGPAPDTTQVVIVASPVADAGFDETVSWVSGGVDVILDGTGSSDPDLDPLIYRWTGGFDGDTVTGPNPMVEFGAPGSFEVTLTVEDRIGLSNTDTATINVVNAPPNCAGAEPSVSRLWPPNHRFRDITVSGVTDPSGDPVTVTLSSIFQDEAVDARGSGNTAPDGQGVGTSTAQVRAERSGRGNGRVYYIGLTADDGLGGTCDAVVEVGVPHNKKATPVGEGPLFDSTTTP